MNRLIRIALTFLLVMTSGVIQAEIVIYPVHKASTMPATMTIIQ